MLMPTTLGVAASGDSGMAVKQAFSILNRLRLWEIELKRMKKIFARGIPAGGAGEHPKLLLDGEDHDEGGSGVSVHL